MLSKLKETIWANAKNALGWKSKRKYVVFAVDDYGNVRLASKAARERLDKAGLKVLSAFDAFDTLETENDLSALFEVLQSVKDVHGRPAVFSPLALPMNIDFDRIEESGEETFFGELLTDTFQKTPGYEGVFSLWQEGISKGIFMPEFHGREHLNLKVFNHLLRQRHPEILANLSQRSYTSISAKPFSEIEFPAAFQFQHFNENEGLKTIIREGLEAFHKVFGFKAALFNAPGGHEHRALHEALAKGGVKFIESVTLFKEHQGEGKYRTVVNFTGRKNYWKQSFLVRNCVFEPSQNPNIDWVLYTLDQIEAAFRWNRPAHISSHRVNFCGHIDEKNRKSGLSTLRQLLHKIIQKWPDVEFISARELGEKVIKDHE